MNKQKFDVVILAGGKGTRIKKYLNGQPKPMVKIKNITFLETLIQNISKYNVNNIIILAGFRGKKIHKKFNNKKINLVNIKCIIEKKPLGTGGCLQLIKKDLTKKFVVMNGDTFFDIDLNSFSNFKIKKEESLIALSKNNSYQQNTKLIGLSINEGKKIFLKKGAKLFNGGIYLFNKNFINKIPKKNCSLEKDILEGEILKKKVYGKLFNNYFIDIGTPNNLKKANKTLVNYLFRPAVFLDRDGTINVDKGYTYKIKDLKLIDKTIKLIQYLKSKNYYIFIVTNQAGIAKGYFKINDFYNFQNNLKNVLFKKNILIDDVSFCPFHKKGIIKEYKKDSKFRKPDNLMISSLIKRYNINLKKSLVIGDKDTDKKCAKKIGLKYIDINSKFLDNELKKFID